VSEDKVDDITPLVGEDGNGHDAKRIVAVERDPLAMYAAADAAGSSSEDSGSEGDSGDGSGSDADDDDDEAAGHAYAPLEEE
jgi:hypothetical protein